jgi:hypothetical protein
MPAATSRMSAYTSEGIGQRPTLPGRALLRVVGRRYSEVWPSSLLKNISSYFGASAIHS